MTIKKMIFGLAAMLLLAACGMISGKLPEQPTAIPTLTPALSATQDPNMTPVPALGGKPTGDLLVWLFSNPNPPVRGDNTFEVLVTDLKGQPITDAAITFDINMTNMNHGKNVVTASSLGEGHYRGVVHFLMAGPWRVIVGIDRAGKTNTVRFDFEVNW
jgi:ABC-type glycerol-3-phosphate transport system substrate-binding protein